MDAGGSEGEGKGQGVCAGGNVEGRGRDEGRGIGSGGCSEVRRAVGVGGGGRGKGLTVGRMPCNPQLWVLLPAWAAVLGYTGRLEGDPRTILGPS